MKEMSLPSWERGLKCKMVTGNIMLRTSLPSWERGLKYGEAQDETQDEASLPSWERGLKSGTATAPGTAAAGRSPRGSVD